MKTKILLSTLFVSFLFVTNLNAQNQTFEWVKQMGGFNYDAGFSITTDIDGNVYTTGYFQRTVDFDPGPGTTNLTSAGKTDIFVQKLDASGNLLWVKQMGGSKIEEGRSIATDVNGDVYTTGYFSDTVDFDPGNDTTFLIAEGITDIFIQKLDANGNFLWAKQMGGTSENLERKFF